jgi:hypothetical protein
MKAIKSIKKTKEVELGEIRRVDDKTAHNMVGNLWQYISKSEWKNATRVVSSEEPVKIKKNEKTSKKD